MGEDWRTPERLAAIARLWETRDKWLPLLGNITTANTRPSATPRSTTIRRR